jgi:hypothetical protein
MPIYERGKSFIGAHQAVSKDVWFAWPDFFLAASLNMSASVAVAQISACMHALRFNNTKATCTLWAQRGAPTDAASSGSGLLVMEWTDGTTAAAVAVVAACLYAYKHDSLLSAASLLASTCATVTGGGTASDLNSTSLVAVSAPAGSPTGLLLRFTPNAADADNTSGSNFHLLGLKYLYKSEGFGSG